MVGFRIAILGLIMVSAIAQMNSARAATVKFEPIDNADVTGFVIFDDSHFTDDLRGDHYWVSNADITALWLRVAFNLGDGQEFAIFDSSNIVTTDFTLFDLSGPSPALVNGAGSFADNGLFNIGFHPSQPVGGSDADGDASLLLEVSGTGAPIRRYEVQWSVAPVSQVPLPGAF